jgi:hypothetical protein
VVTCTPGGGVATGTVTETGSPQTSVCCR